MFKPSAPQDEDEAAPEAQNEQGEHMSLLSERREADLLSKVTNVYVVTFN